MKKVYIMPSVKVVTIATAEILAGSIKNANTDYSLSDGLVDDEEVSSADDIL